MHHTDPVAAPSRPARSFKRPLLLFALPALCLAASMIVYLNGGRYVETDNAYVKSEKVPVGAEVAGMVKEVLVSENQQVVAGQPLYRLDPAPFRISEAQAEAKLAQVLTDLAALKASYREKQAEINLARTRHSFALREQARQTELAAKNFISAARLDEAKQNALLAAQQIAALDQDLKRIDQSLGGIDAPVRSHPAYLAAQAALDQTRLDLSRIEVRSPISGAASKLPKSGQHIGAGEPALVLVGSGNSWIEANFQETDLTHVHPGQSTTIRIDTFPETEFNGTVESLSPATGAEFSLLPAQNATGNWVKIAQRIPVRIRLIAAKNMPQLRAGLSATVRIDTGHKRQLLGFSF